MRYIMKNQNHQTLVAKLLNCYTKTQLDFKFDYRSIEPFNNFKCKNN